MGNINTIVNSGGGKYRIDHLSFLLEECKIKKKQVVEHIENLNNAYPMIQRLEITSCKLKELPANIRDLVHLSHLILVDNKLSSLPWSLPFPVSPQASVTISSVVSEGLTKLDLSHNHFSSFPSCVFVLPNLVVLNLDHNQLSDINVTTVNTSWVTPTTTPKPYIVCKLRELRLSNNNFSAFPDIITELTSLQLLDLSGNSLSTLPASFTNLANIQTLNLKTNKFTSFPTSICTLGHLSHLNISHNQITIGKDHHHLGISLLPSLTSLELQHNKFSEFPMDVCDITSLKVLKMQDNDIDSIPEKIGSLVHLQDLFLQENKITTLPASFGNLVDLKKVFLEFNKITKLPAEFSKLTKLNVLIMHNNELKVVPPEIFALKQLVRLSLDDNPLSPQELKQLKTIDGALNLVNQQQKVTNNDSISGSSGRNRGNSVSGGSISSSTGSFSPLSGKPKKKPGHLTISRSLFRGHSSNLEGEKDKFKKQQQLKEQQHQHLQMISEDNDTSPVQQSPITSQITINSAFMEFEDEIQKMINEQNSNSPVTNSEGRSRRSSVFLPPTPSIHKNSQFSSLPSSISQFLNQNQSLIQQAAASGGFLDSPSLTPSYSSPLLSSLSASSVGSTSSSASSGAILAPSSSSSTPTLPSGISQLSISTGYTPPTSSASSSSSSSSLSTSDGSIPSYSKFKGTFDQLLEEQDFSKKKRETLNKLSKEQKWNLLLQYKNSTLKMLSLKNPQPTSGTKSSSSSSSSTNSTPTLSSNNTTTTTTSSTTSVSRNTTFQSAKYYFDNLDTTDISLVKELLEFLKDSGPEVSLFIGYGGIEAITKILKYNLDHHSDAFEEEKVGFCLLCIKYLVEFAPKSVITTNNSINIITMFLNSDSVHIVTIILEIFDELLKLQNIGSSGGINNINNNFSVVIEALNNFKKAKGLRNPYVPLIALLKNQSYDLSTKALLFKIINNLIYSFEVLEERFSVICTMLKLGVLEVVQQLRNFKNNEFLKFELDMFEEVLDSDENELINKIGRREVLKRMSNEYDISKQSEETCDFVRVVMVSAGLGDLKINLNEKTSYSEVIDFIQSHYQIKYDLSRYGLFIPGIGNETNQSGVNQSRWVDPSKSLIENGLSGEIVEFRMIPNPLNVYQSIQDDKKFKTIVIDPQLKCFEIVNYLRSRLDPVAPAFSRKVSTLEEIEEEEDTESDIYGIYCFKSLQEYDQGTWYPQNSRFLDFDFNNIVEVKLKERCLRITFSGTEKLMKFDPNQLVSEITVEIRKEIGLKINVEDYGLSYTPTVGSLASSTHDGFWLESDKRLIDYSIMKNSPVKFKFRPRFLFVRVTAESGISVPEEQNRGLNNTLPISEIIEELVEPHGLNPNEYSLYLSNESNQKIKLLSRHNCLRDQQVVKDGSHILITSKQKDLPSDFNVWDEPEDSPETITYTNSNKVASITLNKLIEKISIPESQDAYLRNTLYLSYRSFITPLILLNKLVERHSIPSSVDVEKGKQIQRKVRSLFKNWLDNETPLNRLEVIELMNLNLPSQTAEDDGSKELYDLFIELTNNSNYTKHMNTDNNHLEKPKSKIPKHPHDSFISLIEIDENELARQLSIMIFPLFSKIETSELINQKWCKAPGQAKNVMEFVNFFNRLSNWISFNVVNTSKLRDRAVVFSKFVKLAQAFCDLKNFHLLMAVLSGLNSSPILRLKFTKSKLSKHSRQNLEDLEALMSTSSSLKNYRQILAETQPPCIPFMGCHLSDLVFIDEGNQQMYGNQINFKKLDLYAKTLTTLQKYTIVPYQFHPVPIIQNLFNDHRIVEEKALYEMSLKCEPRNADRSDLS
ncbi:hypothetical protein CYY_002352 [Polysphondylium violaceum]|uniref:Ras guanine nucleotide exchange factor n=1 Tax=Polysphondylium violaceum TaxID=133409 RepID=A0A8J4Q802_9MYCE|nr:hypothetical protein CYY_002352 [Polysphondylium violaceum]